VFHSLFDKLVDTDADLKIVPTLAASWSISSDATVYTLRLRPGVRFHDGPPFDAQAVVYNSSRTTPIVRAAPAGPCAKARGAAPSNVCTSSCGASLRVPDGMMRLQTVWPAS
jgi:hypothetical protein